MKIVKRIPFILAIVVIVLGFLPITVAAIADPDDMTINAVYTYEDVYEDGDLGVFIDYYIEYAATPTETVTDAYLVSFIDTDGTTQLKTIAPYNGDTNGYGRGIAWIRFTPAEVTAYGLTSANVALYDIWLMGNPTVASGWTGDPPKVIGNLTNWYDSTTDNNVLMALRVLQYAQILEDAWTEDLIESTPLGNKLTDDGEQYFENAIQYLRDIAPNAFSDYETTPTIEDIDYTTEFGATLVNGTGTVAGSPVTLTEGANIETATATGTLTLTLNKNVSGTVTSGDATVTGSPLDVVGGENTITITALGATGSFTVDVELIDTQSVIDDSVTGTAFDLSDAATAFGMTTAMFSGLVWMVITIVICAAVFTRAMRNSFPGAGKVLLLVFDICIIGGGLLGLLPILVAILVFIGVNAFTGYILFFRSSSL